MKEIKLSQFGKKRSLNLVALVDDEDYHFVNQIKWYADKRSGRFYARHGQLHLHRYILCVTDEKIMVDHIDGDALNNQKSNLRKATRSQNGANRIKKTVTSSQYVGVSFHRVTNKWMANIRKDKKLRFLGRFENETDAALAYNKAAVEVHGEFASLNKF